MCGFEGWGDLELRPLELLGAWGFSSCIRGLTEDSMC